MNDYNKGCQMFFVIMRNEPHSEISNVKNHEDISSVRNEYMDLFPEDIPKGLPWKYRNWFQIELKEDVKPIKKGLYRISITELAEIKKQVEYLIRMGFVRPSKSPWAFPVLFASRKDVSLRLCVDYRGLNRFTAKSS